MPFRYSRPPSLSPSTQQAGTTTACEPHEEIRASRSADNSQSLPVRRTAEERSLVQVNVGREVVAATVAADIRRADAVPTSSSSIRHVSSSHRRTEGTNGALALAATRMSSMILIQRHAGEAIVEVVSVSIFQRALNAPVFSEQGSSCARRTRTLLFSRLSIVRRCLVGARGKSPSYMVRIRPRALPQSPCSRSSSTSIMPDA